MRGTTPRRHADDGVYAIEMLGLLGVFLMAVVAAFQLAAINGATTMAENAARAGSRAIGQGGDAGSVALGAIDPGMRDRTTVGGASCGGPITGPTVTVCIDVPVMIPLVDLDATRIQRSATLPPRGLGRG